MSQPIYYTPRGFGVWAEFRDTYRSSIRVQTSSAAFVDRCWIYVDDNPDPRMGEAAAHLNRQQAITLANALLAWAETAQDDNEDEE